MGEVVQETTRKPLPTAGTGDEPTASFGPIAVGNCAHLAHLIAGQDITTVIGNRQYETATASGVVTQAKRVVSIAQRPFDCTLCGQLVIDSGVVPNRVDLDDPSPSGTPNSAVRASGCHRIRR
jgi:hypothetical protein